MCVNGGLRVSLKSVSEGTETSVISYLPMQAGALQNSNDEVPRGQGGPIRRVRDRSGQRLTRAVFTLNNYTEEEYSYLTKEFAPNHCRWMVIGKEIGDTGTSHLQGACVAERFQTCNCSRCIGDVPSILSRLSPSSSPYKHGLWPICAQCGHRHPN